MKFSIISMVTMATLALAAPTPNTESTGLDLITRSTVPIVVSSDTGDDTINVDNVATTDSEGGTDLADALLTIASQVNQLIQGMVNDDIKRRQAFTKNVVSRLRQRYPMHSVVISNVGYSFSGSIVHKLNTKCSTKIGKDVTYDIIMWDHGAFTLKGDGGFQNWAYILNSGCQHNGGWLSCK